MMLHDKLASRSGLSLSVALVLFMACAVVGTVVLAAASAVGGRTADLTELDQRYYSVVSAVSLLEKELCGHPVTIERTKLLVTKVTTDYTTDDSPVTGDPDYQVTYDTVINEGSAISVDPVERDAKDVKLDDLKDMADEDRPKLGQRGAILPGRSFLTSMAVSLLFGDSAFGKHKLADGITMYCNTEEAMSYTFSNSNAAADGEYDTDREYGSGSFSLAPDGQEHDVHNLTVNCTYHLMKDGTLVLDVTDSVSLLGLTNYTMKLTLTPVFEETPLLKNSEISYLYNDDGTQETEKETTMSQRTSTVSWRVEGVQ